MSRLFRHTFFFLAAFQILILKASADKPLTLADVALQSDYPWKKNIVTTCFWVGQGATSYDDMTNYKSAWDSAWTKNFGGVDYPTSRVSDKGGSISLPKKFAPTLNPFYIALPFNDVKCPKLAKKYVPWWSFEKWKRSPYQSQCKGRWVMIEYRKKVAFAQWEDVGPFRHDHANYVFGEDRPTIYSNAGLDVSPAIHDYLGLNGLNKTNWRFVEANEVPYGPWIKYGEQAIVYSAIKSGVPRKNKRS